MKHYPKKPATLDADCAWVSVSKVEDGTGVKEDELAWCVEYVAATRYTFLELARDAAACWYRETDQSGDCIVTLRIEDAIGAVVEVAVACEIVTKMTCRNSPRSQDRVGVDPRPERKAVGA